MLFPKKEKERITIKYFMDKYPDFPDGKLVLSEAPDFILRENSRRTIGIELTQLVDHRYGNSFYNNVETSLIQTLGVDIIRQILDHKEAKIRNYRKKKLDQIWLLITADNLDLPGSFNIKEEISGWVLKTSFDKVFLFDLFKGQVVELPIAK